MKSEKQTLATGFRSDNGLHLETLLLHGKGKTEAPAGASAFPIFQSAAFSYDSAESLEAVFAGREPGYMYSRIANPTVAAFERRLAILEGGLGAVAFASGMAAISALALGLAGAGDEIVSGNSLFGGTWSLFTETLPRYGIKTRFVETTDVEAYRAAIGDRTKLVFLETIGNPKMDVPDIAAIGNIAREKGVVFAVDNTVTTPYLCRPKEFGADLIIHSTTKFINGHGTAVGGILVDCGSFDWSAARYAHIPPVFRRAREMAFLAYLRSRIRRDFGSCLAPLNAFLMSVGIESLGVRMERQCDNALRVADFLAAHPHVRDVRYPGLAEHPAHELARRQFNGRFGALLTMRLADKHTCFHCVNRLKLAAGLANLGDARTLVIHPASTIYRDFTEDERRSAGVGDDWLRLSIGIEHPEDLIADIAAALNPET